MIELDFMVAPQVTAGKGPLGAGHVLNVEVTASPAIFPDHDEYVTVRLSQGKVMLAEQTRVRRSQRDIEATIALLGHDAGALLDRELVRKRKALGHD